MNEKRDMELNIKYTFNCIEYSLAYIFDKVQMELEVWTEMPIKNWKDTGRNYMSKMVQSLTKVLYAQEISLYHKYMLILVPKVKSKYS